MKSHQNYDAEMAEDFSFFDDNEEGKLLITVSGNDKFNEAEPNEIYVYCKCCQRTHRWLECKERQIN